MTTEHVTLVVSGTGKTGRRVAERLKAKNVPTRVASRAGNPPFDWENRDTWAPALRDVRSVYLTYQPDLAVPGAADAIRAFTDLAVANGVRHIVLVSGRGEAEGQRCEQIVQSCGAAWTILRASWYFQNFGESYLLEPVLQREVVLPAGEVPEPFIDADDIADVAVAALTEDGHAGKVYELTGPRLLTFAQAVEEIARASGRPIRYVQVSSEQYASLLAEQQVPADYAWLLEYLFTTVMDGRNAHLEDGIQRALGRHPRDFADYARETATSGVWSD